MNSKIILQCIWEEPASTGMFGDVGPHKLTVESNAGITIFQFMTLAKQFILGAGYSEKSWQDGLEYALEEYTNDGLLNVSREETAEGFQFSLGEK